MRKSLLLLMIVIVVVAALPLARGEETEKKFQVIGDLRVRYDRLDNYFDLDNGMDDNFSFWPYRALVGLEGQLSDDVQVVLQIQNLGSYGNQSPVQGLTFPPFQNFDGDGSVNGTRRGETSLYEGKVILNKIAGSDVSVTLGRQEDWFGTGLILGNEPFYNGTVFDGAKGVWSGDDWSATGFLYKIAERQDPASGQFPHFSSSDANIYGLRGDYKLGTGLPSRIEAYIIRYADGDEASRLNFFTIGAHWWRAVKTKADAEELGFDWNAEFAIQKGKALDPATDERLHLKRGYICNDSLGYNFVAGNTIHRVYGAYIRQSGDDDVTDDDVEGWIPLFPTVHDLYGDADFFDSNFAQNEASIQALSLGYDANIGEGTHVFGARVWSFKPVENHVLFLAGGMKEKIQSYGAEIDLVYHYIYSNNVTLSAGVAQLRPRDGLAGVGNPDSNVTRAWAQAGVHF